MIPTTMLFIKMRKYLVNMYRYSKGSFFKHSSEENKFKAVHPNVYYQNERKKEKKLDVLCNVSTHTNNACVPPVHSAQRDLPGLPVCQTRSSIYDVSVLSSYIDLSIIIQYWHRHNPASWWRHGLCQP